MSYSVYLKTDRAILMSDAQAAVDALPKDLQHFGGEDIANYRTTSFQAAWGWAAACDLSFPEDCTWRISGSHSCSGHLVARTVDALSTTLRKRGFNIEVDWGDFEGSRTLVAGPTSPDERVVTLAKQLAYVMHAPWHEVWRANSSPPGADAISQWSIARTESTWVALPEERQQWWLRYAAVVAAEVPS